MQVTPFLWIQHPVDEAVEFYIRLFPDAQTLDGPHVSEHMSSATIALGGQTLHIFNAGTYRELTEAFSLMVTCSTQEEIDRLWEALGDGGTPSRCGWVTDRFGITWQIIPEKLQEWLADPAHGHEVTRVMLDMVKLEIGPLQAALED
jgi:predicted 3-demethylubiquinone-9 3-methyltransferase (glyoxalase superfamily)